MKDVIEIKGERYVSTTVLKERYGMTGMTATRWARTGQLPKPKCIGSQNYFNEKEVEDILANS